VVILAAEHGGPFAEGEIVVTMIEVCSYSCNGPQSIRRRDRNHRISRTGLSANDRVCRTQAGCNWIQIHCKLDRNRTARAHAHCSWTGGPPHTGNPAAPCRRDSFRHR